MSEREGLSTYQLSRAQDPGMWGWGLSAFLVLFSSVPSLPHPRSRSDPSNSILCIGDTIAPTADRSGGVVRLITSGGRTAVFVLSAGGRWERELHITHGGIGIGLGQQRHQEG